MGIAKTTQLQTIYKEVLGYYSDHKAFLWKHRGGFVHYIQTATTKGLLDARFSRKHFKLERLSYELDPARDDLLSNETVTNLAEQHLLRDDHKFLETPQYFWMRQAMTQALHAPSPTRMALKLYDELSKQASMTAPQKYSPSLFNHQQLLFDITRPISKANNMLIPTHYYQHGWAILDESIADEFEAIRLQEAFLASIDASKLPMHQRFRTRIQLAKADQIPVCDDIVATSFQVLHFDMGHPFLESNNQLFISHVGIYLPKTTRHIVTARTRLVELGGILKHTNLSAQEIEHKLTAYVQRYGDGWTGHNTYRLACFIRFLDALSDKPELQDQIDKTVGQWFDTASSLDELSAHHKEITFYAKHGIHLDDLEHQITLKPGQLLILDNTRVIHGRIGHRRAKELFNFMWGIKAITPEDITRLRSYMCQYTWL